MILAVGARRPVLNQAIIIAVAIIYGALILGADLLLETGDVIAIAYLGMAFPCLWLAWAPGPILCALVGALFVAIGGIFGADDLSETALALAARGGSVVALLGAGLLAAGRIKADQALHLAIERFTDVLEVSADWIWETDTEHRYTFLSRRAYELTGFTEADLVGSRRIDLLRKLEVDGDVSGHMADLIARRPFQGFSCWAMSPNGRRCFSLSGKPLFDRKGRFIGYRGAGQDVTERALIAEQLEQASEAAEAANLAKSEFLSTMSHELRTPLNAILGFSEVISDELFGRIANRKYVEYAKDIQSSGRHLLDMINDILDISRIESGRLELAEEPVALAEVVDQAVLIMEERVERAGVTLSVDVQPSLQNVLGDERAVMQVLLNLLSNAVKFTPSGGQVAIRVSGEKGGGVRLVVQDTGVGIAPGEISKLMLPFSQANTKV